MRHPRQYIHFIEQKVALLRSKRHEAQELAKEVVTILTEIPTPPQIKRSLSSKVYDHTAIARELDMLQQSGGKGK